MYTLSLHDALPISIEELYTFLKQADAVELNDYFRELDAAREAGDSAKEKEIIQKIDNFETHIVPIIADIDAGFGNEEAIYLRSEEHTSELQSRGHLVCRLLLEKKKKK